MLIGIDDQLRAQAAYIFRGNYGLAFARGAAGHGPRR